MDIKIVVTKDVTIGRNEDRCALTLHGVTVHTNPRHGGRFIYLPGVATCDGYRSVNDAGEAQVNAREASAIFRRACKGFASATLPHGGDPATLRSEVTE